MKGIKMKKITISAVLLFAVIATFAVNETISSKANSDPLPAFNIRVMQYGGASPQINAQVIYKVGGSTVHTGTTDVNGWCYITLATATYDVYVFYPAQPNDGQSGSLLGYYHDSNDNETIVLGPNY
ncbi:MAG: hypothetical protein IPM96_11565 [Ignavibacteria bacterium]|nr:hypothetical protein [Ignavibacteria bacterium]